MIQFRLLNVGDRVAKMTFKFLEAGVLSQQSLQNVGGFVLDVIHQNDFETTLL